MYKTMKEYVAFELGRSEEGYFVIEYNHPDDKWQVEQMIVYAESKEDAWLQFGEMVEQGDVEIYGDEWFVFGTLIN